ncbi:MAG: DUF448 domain-containing protein [Candidatus Bipolaricaulia bacterium]
MPERTCVGCRKTKEKAELIRLVCPEDRPIVDLEAKLPGRGAYVCPERSCVERGANVKRLSRAFRKPVSMPGGASSLREDILTALKKRILSLLGRARRAGKVVSGWNNLKSRLNELQLILVAEDASNHVWERFGRLEDAFRLFTKQELGAAIGKPPRSAVGVTDSGLSARIGEAARRYASVTG